MVDCKYIEAIEKAKTAKAIKLRSLGLRVRVFMMVSKRAYTNRYGGSSCISLSVSALLPVSAATII
eukprot:scaffold46617_cov117-Skeletonema_marinoi.AAC.2